MKYSTIIFKLFLAIVLLMGSTLSSAFPIFSTTVFAKPGKICVPQTYLRENFFGENKGVMIDHFLIVRDEDHHFKNGDVFVGFRHKDIPGVLWLYDGENWTVHDNTNDPVPFKSRYDGYYEKLQPVTLIHFSKYPVDVSGQVGKGQLLVGYGLRSEEESAREAFADMMSNERLRLVWNIGENIGITSADRDNANTLCLGIAEIEEVSELGVEEGSLIEILDIISVDPTQ